MLPKEISDESSIALVIWLCKRQYMNKDVFCDRYGRLYEIPFGLSCLSPVALILLSYHASADYPKSQTSGDLNVYARSGSSTAKRCFRWTQTVWSVLHTRKAPTVIFASSDALHIIIGGLLSKVFRIPFFADLYDNYESFGLSKYPLIKPLYEWSLKRAAGISVVSSTLSTSINQKYPHVPCIVVESTIDKSLFYPRNQSEARASIGAENTTLIGICGGLNTEHDIITVYKACELLYQQGFVFSLLVAGDGGDVEIPNRPYVRHIGKLTHCDMPTFFSALDIALIPMSQGQFGYYAFPQKAYEILACKVPAIAANVGAIAELFSKFDGVTYQPGSPESLARAIKQQIRHPIIADIQIPSWSEQCYRLNTFIRSTLANTH